MNKSIFITVVFFTIPFPSFSQNIELGQITIEKSFWGNSTQGLDYFFQEEIENLPSFSLEEIADYSSSVDLRKRSVFGIQQDISLRGSIFEDISIQIQGIEINDPQTGHFSLEIPLTSADLEHIEIFKNAQKINFTPKKPAQEGFLFKTSFGQHALWEKLLSFNFPLGTISNRLSGEHKISKGERQDTDFEIYNFSFHSLWEKQDREIEFLFGSTKRDFGADSFYSSFYPHEEEHITQRFFSLRTGLKEEVFRLNNTLYLRKHTDKYILDRHNPPFYTNYHTTYVYGLNNELDFNNDLFFSFDIEREKIDSTNLNEHRCLKKGVTLGVKEKEIGKVFFNLSGGVDYYENWEYLENIHLSMAYFLKDTLKLRFSFDRLWRTPSFTELYYSSPANIGNPDLNVQKSNNFEWGMDYFPDESFNLTLNLFSRKQSNTIDWGKNISSDPWEAKNAGNVNVYGMDFYSQIKFNHNILKKFSLGHTYLHLDKDNPYNFSKYVFNYNRHKIVSMCELNLKGISVNLISNFSKPADRKQFVTFDLKAEKKISNFTLTVEGINIFNKDYQETKDIEGAGRWIKMSIVYSF